MLPQKQPLELMQTSWAQQLNPVIANQLLNGILLKNQVLTTGTNIINHKLGRNLQGWIPTRVRASATFYDTQDNNQSPNLTLVIVSSANCTIDLWVF